MSPANAVAGVSLPYTKTSSVEQGAIFKSNSSQAVRLPKSVARPDDVKRVDAVAISRSRILRAAGEPWDSWFDGEEVSPHFMSAREQPGDQEREGSSPDTPDHKA